MLNYSALKVITGTCIVCFGNLAQILTPLFVLRDPPCGGQNDTKSGGFHIWRSE